MFRDLVKRVSTDSISDHELARSFLKINVASEVWTHEDRVLARVHAPVIIFKFPDEYEPALYTVRWLRHPLMDVDSV